MTEPNPEQVRVSAWRSYAAMVKALKRVSELNAELIRARRQLNGDLPMPLPPELLVRWSKQVRRAERPR